MVRHVSLSTMARWWARSGRSAQALARPRVHFVYLHSVLGRDESRFRGLVRSLGQQHELITYSEAVRRVHLGPISSPAVCFSFDDGFVSGLRAAEVLEAHGTTACFFVPTGFIGCRSVADARAFFRTADGVDEPALTWFDLERLRDHGHEVGNHTVSHQDIARLSEQQTQDEIGNAAIELRQRLGECHHFAWPFGRFRSFTEQAARVVFETSHISCASAERGAHYSASIGSCRRQCLRRDHVMAEWPLAHSQLLIARSAASRGPVRGPSPKWP